MKLHNTKQSSFLMWGIGEVIVKVEGWETSYTLGVIAQGAPSRFFPVLLMAGRVLCDGFDRLDQAVLFNTILSEEKTVFLGTPFLPEIWQRAGGQDTFETLVRRCHDEARKEAP